MRIGGACLIAITIVTVMSGAEDSTRTARLFVHAWQPQLGPVPANPDELERSLKQVADLARSGDFARAEQLMAGLERQNGDVRAGYLLPHFRRELLRRKGDFLGGQRSAGSTGFGAEDGRIKGESDRLMVEGMQKGLAASSPHRDQASAILMFGIISNVCISGLAPLRSVTARAAEQADLRPLAATTAALDPEKKCPEMVQSFAEGVIPGGVLLPASQQLLAWLVDSKAAQSRQNFTEARTILMKGYELARQQGWKDTAAIWLLQAGDLDAAPFGSVYSLGFDLENENYVRTQLSSGLRSAALAPVAEAALAAAGKTYEQAATLVLRDSAELLLRRAYLAYAAGEPAAGLYRRAASSARLESNARIAIAAYAAAALLDSNGEDFARAVKSASDAGYTGGTLSLVELAESHATRLRENGDTYGAAARLRKAMPAFYGLDLRRPLVSLLSLLASLEEEVGSDDAAIETYERLMSINRQSVMQARKVNADLRSEGRADNDFAFAVMDLQNLLFELVRLTLALDRKITSEGITEWVERRDRAEQQFHEAAKELELSTPKEMPPVFDTAAALRMVNERLSEVLERNKAVADLRGRDCESIRESLDEIGNRIAGAQSLRTRLYLASLAAPCDSRFREMAVSGLKALHPVGTFIAALEAQARQPGVDTATKVSEATAELRFYTETAGQAGAGALIGEWMNRLLPLIPQRPRFVELSQWARLQQAKGAMLERKPAEASRILNAIAASNPFWDAQATPEFRYKVRLAAAESAFLSSQAEEALLMTERAAFEREKWFRAKNGLDANDGTTAEYAMLLRQAAVSGSLGSQESKRLEEFRRRAFEVKTATMPEPTLDAIRAGLARLPKRTTLLVFQQFPSGFAIWRIDSGGAIRMMPASGEAMRIQHDAITLRSRAAVNEPDGTGAGRRLYRDLLEPAGPFEAGWTLAIAGQDQLGAMPFDVLLDRDGKPLISQHPIVYVERLTPEDAEDRAGGRVSKVVIAGLNSRILQFPEQDAERAAAVFHVAPLTGEKATPQSVLKALPGAEWVHLSTHGTLRQANPYLSYLELFGGKVKAWELFGGLRSAQFLVLSACDTRKSLEAPSPQNGVQSLSMASLAARAGVRRVLASAWKVEDASGGELMQAFYSEMAKDARHPAESLRRAKLRLLNQEYLPYEYANFMFMVRDPGTIEFAGRIGR